MQRAAEQGEAAGRPKKGRAAKPRKAAADVAAEQDAQQEQQGPQYFLMKVDLALASHHSRCTAPLCSLETLPWAKLPSCQWLQSEPDVFSIDDLASRPDMTEPWDGEGPPVLYTVLCNITCLVLPRHRSSQEHPAECHGCTRPASPVSCGLSWLWQGCPARGHAITLDLMRDAAVSLQGCAITRPKRWAGIVSSTNQE
jgi:hypothetical protein